MGSSSVSSCLLFVLNLIQVLLGLALAAASLWFFIEFHAITSLRNSNHHLLDFKVYWPQAIPWVFLLVAAFILCVSCCGFTGAKRKNQGFVVTYIIFEVIAVLALVSAASVGLFLADSKSTDEFIKNTCTEAFLNTEMNSDVAKAFGKMERRLQCCGSVGPTDYFSSSEFPISCCDTSSQEWQSQIIKKCEKGNQLANQRHGCSEVVITYSRLIIEVLSGTAVFAAVIGIFNVLIAVLLSRSLRNKLRVPKYAESEISTIKK